MLRILDRALKCLIFCPKLSINAARCMGNCGTTRGFSEKVNKQWLKRHINDPYVKASKKMNYRSRAAFKLLEIDSRYSLLKPGIKVLEIGSTPGSWTQIMTQKLKATTENPAVIAVDILDMKPVIGSVFIKGDVTAPQTHDEIEKALGGSKVDMVCSDAVPELAGEQDLAHEDTIALNFVVVDACMKYLKYGGTLLMKTMQGSIDRKLKTHVKKHFSVVNYVKPAASRAESREMYLLAKEFLMGEANQKVEEAKAGDSDSVNTKKPKKVKKPTFDLKSSDKIDKTVIRKALLRNLRPSKKNVYWCCCGLLLKITCNSM